jgi:hypothetical protein
MRPRYVVDTNVLIAASAADPDHPNDIDATPEEPQLREQVWQWLDRFQRGDARLVLDGAGRIMEEYSRKLGFNDFGIQVVMHKWSTAAVDDVELAYDRDGSAMLPAALAGLVHDNADRKMVAAALASRQAFGEGCIVFAGDTDWHGWEAGLLEQGLLLEPIIEAWSRARYALKQAR